MLEISWRQWQKRRDCDRTWTKLALGRPQEKGRMAQLRLYWHTTDLQNMFMEYKRTERSGKEYIEHIIQGTVCVDYEQMQIMKATLIIQQQKGNLKIFN